MVTPFCINVLLANSLHVGEQNVSEGCRWIVTGVFERRLVLRRDRLRFLDDVCRLFERDRRSDRLLRLVRPLCLERLHERRRLLCLLSSPSAFSYARAIPIG